MNRRSSTHRVAVPDPNGCYIKNGERFRTVMAKGVRNPEYSSGRTYYDKREIRISLGNDRIDAKGVALHELAHWLTPGHSHDAVFYRKAISLYREYLLPAQAESVIARERKYKPNVVNALAP